MIGLDRFNQPHPLCTCPPLTFSGPAPDRSKCAGGAIAHPVLGRDDLAALAALYERPEVTSVAIAGRLGVANGPAAQ